MEDKPDDNEIFESIIEENNMEAWLKKSRLDSITISDIYEGLAILSGLQADLHEYLKLVINCVFQNNQAGFEVEELPQLTSQQVGYLKQIFESAALFLEEEGV